MFNDLFWALYWIDVLSGLPRTVVTTAAILGVLAALLCLICALNLSDRHDTTAEQDRADHKKIRKKIMWWYVGLVLLSVPVSLVPSKQTMYMMLGVKATDNIVNSETGKKLQEIVNKEIDGYLEKFNKK